MAKSLSIDRFFSECAEYYDDLLARDLSSEVEFFSRIMVRNGVKTVLDAGCGSGSHCLMLENKGFKVTGVDNAAGMIDKAKEKAKRSKVSFFRKDLRNLSGLGKFDCIISLSVLHYFKKDDLVRILAEFNKHLNSDGMIVFDLPAPRFLSEQDNIVKMNKKGSIFLYKIVRKISENKDKQTSHLIYVVDSPNKIKSFAGNLNLYKYKPDALAREVKKSGLEIVKTYWDDNTSPDEKAYKYRIVCKKIRPAGKT
jgi:SAM-dependent methyltransferase